MHGGRSKRGADHPNFRHGQRAKEPIPFDWLKEPRLCSFTIFLFPKRIGEMPAGEIQGGALQGYIVKPSGVTVDEWASLLRTVRGKITKELDAMRESP
jgi:hypothetical protein